MHPLLGIAAVLVTLAVLMALLKVIEHWLQPPAELVRKLLHVGMGSVVLTFPWLFDRTWPVVLLAAIATAALAVVRLAPALRDGVGTVLNRVQRPSLGEIYFAIAVGVLFWLSAGNPLLFCLPMLIMTLADATAALIAGGSEITTHFASAPFYYQSLAGNKNVRKVLSSYDILGGKATFNVVYTTQKFNEQNPKTYQAFYDALAEAAEIIRTDKKKAAEIFIRVQKSKLSPELVQQIIEDPENDFTISPHRTYVYAEELHKLGILKNKAASWKDYFFSAAYANPGS